MNQTYVTIPTNVKAYEWLNVAKKVDFEALDVDHYGTKNDGSKNTCETCKKSMSDHGTLSVTGQSVCPGDFIITHKDGHRYVLSAKEFKEKYCSAAEAIQLIEAY